MKMDRNYKVFRRKVKYLRLEINDGLLSVILPQKSNIDFKYVIASHKNWIDSKFKLLDEIYKLSKNCKIFNQINLEKIIFNYIKKFEKILKIKPTAVSFRLMKRRWGSCTQNNKLIFNKFLKYLPKDLIKYVVAHEMCHLLIKNHKKEFWLLVKKLEPNFIQKQKLLASYKVKLRF
jgi:predicted metal-dependent hydrolase